MANGTHIIHRVVLDIEVSGRGMAKSAETAIVNYFEQVLLKRIEQILDDIDNEGHLIIDKIDIDLDKIFLKDDIPVGLEGKFIEAFQSVTLGLTEPKENEENTFAKLTGPQKALRVFIYFLQNGRLPWYALSALQNEKAWLDQIYRGINENASKSEILHLIKQPKIIGRLFAQFNRSTVRKLTALLLNLDTGDIDLIINEQVKQYTANNPTSGGEAFVFFEKIILLMILRSADKQVIAWPQLQNQIARIPFQPENSILEDLQMVDKLLSTATQKINEDTIGDGKKPQAQDTEPAGVFVTQAGLVILHPFLEYFFKDFGLIQDDDFVYIHARQLGVHLLHYLATGQVNAFEYDLYFEKFFCCWPADEIIERVIDIPQLMRDEADNMLKAVIKHWKALKNTSPAGLREGFLTRNGKLIENEIPARLIIEKKDMDVLLATLPWGIGVVKLPWMREPFYVEWQ